VRYALLSGHPRKQLNFTLDSLHAAESALGTLRRVAQDIGPAAAAPVVPPASGPFVPVYQALHDDLNLPAALGALFTALNALAPGAGTAADRAALAAIFYALGLDFSAPATEAPACPPEVAALAERRLAAKKARDFETADRLRAELAAAGWNVRDGKDGSILEPAKKG
jgi:cysteinyl-tRNA synthetase